MTDPGRGYADDEEEEIQFIGTPPPMSLQPIAVRPASRSKPLLVIHYHLFKNAGSSFDETLRQSFGSRWAEQEFTRSRDKSNVDQVQAFLLDNPGLSALSSHTALLPLPEIEGVEIFPVFFVRHPLLRLRSAYMFERTQDVDTFGARLARSTDFQGYIEGLLDQPNHRQVRDFQAWRLSFGDDQGQSEAEKAFRTIRALPFIGLVEAYDDSLRQLDALLMPYTDEFRPAFVRRNTSANRHHLTIAEQLEEVRDELGDDLYIRLEATNLVDLRIFEMVASRYALPPLAPSPWLGRD